MAKAKDDMYILWPEYFDIGLTRAKGRRMPKSLSVQSPEAEEIFNIARKLGLSPVMESDKAFPSKWMSGKGRVKVSKKYNKTQTMRMIAERLSSKRN